MHSFLSTSVGPIHWHDYGGSGNPVLLIHGLGGSLLNWNAIGPELTEIGRTVAIDLPGFGLSPPTRDWELPTHVEAIVSVIENLGNSATVVGNSMGGLLAEMVASSRPDLVDGLILIAPAVPPTFPDPTFDWPTAVRLAIQSTPYLGPAVARIIMRRMSPEQLVHMSLDLITHDKSRISPSIVSDFEDQAATRYQFPWAPDAVPMTGRSIAGMVLRPSRYIAMIRDIVAPTLVVQGVADPIVSPTAVERICALRPDWQFVQMEDTGHTPQLDAPARTLEVLLPWLKGQREREITA